MLRRIRAHRAATHLERFIRDHAASGRVNLLAPDRSVFRFDCDALDRFAPELNIIRFASMKQLPSMMLGEHEGLAQRQVGSPDGSVDDPFRGSQPALLRALRACVDAGHLQGFLTANVDYHQDEPLRRAARHLGLPFFVILKETPLSAEHEAWQRRAIGEQPIPDRGDHVFVGGPRGVLYVELGSVAPDRLHVTGFPRFDRYRELDDDIPLDRVTLFPPNRLHDHQESVFDDVLDSALSLRDRTSSILVLKCKDNRAARDVRSALDERSVHTDRVVVTTRNPAQDLPRSALVVGSSTTALAEALMTRAHVMNLISKNDLLGIPARPDLGFETYPDHRSLISALDAITDLSALAVGAGDVVHRRGLVDSVLTVPEHRTSSASIEEVVVRVVAASRGGPR